MTSTTDSATTIPLDGHVFTTRPTTLDDLPDYQRDGHTIATIHGLDQCLEYPVLGQHLLAAVEEARLSGLVVDKGVITIPLTDDEITKRIENAQGMWDRTRDKYIEAYADPTSVNGDVWRYSVDPFAKAEGLPAVDWDRVSA